MIGIARFSMHSHPVGFALEDGSMRVAGATSIWLLTCAYLWSCRLSFGDAMGMVF